MKNKTKDNGLSEFLLVIICVITIFCSAFNWSRLFWMANFDKAINMEPFLLKALFPFVVAVIVLIMTIFDFSEL